MRLEEYDVSTQYAARVLTSQRLTPSESTEEVRELILEAESDTFHASVGQNIGVLAPGRRELGQEHHYRLYSVADVPRVTADGRQQLSICVRRCNYIDAFSGEEYPGVASNYLCDLQPGEMLTITGPYGQAFALPREHDANMILIGAGTGIAPFRAFIKHIYQRRPDFGGSILLVHGAQTGLELLYQNDEKNDFAMYYDRGTFEAVEALSKRPGWSDSIDWQGPLKQRATMISQLLQDPKTYVYLAGLVEIRDQLDQVFAEVVGSVDQWQQWKTTMEADGRWVELLYS